MSYHVRREDREITDQAELNKIILNNRVAILSLCDKNEPYIVTLTYGYDQKEQTLYFHCGKEGLKIDIIKRNPNTCLTIIEEDGSSSKICNHPYRSLVIRGKVDIIEDKEESDNAIKLMLNQLEAVDIEREISKLNASNKFYNNLQILKVKIKQITGKEKRNG